jgi:hypothetical protein
MAGFWMPINPANDNGPLDDEDFDPAELLKLPDEWTDLDDILNDTVMTLH